MIVLGFDCETGGFNPQETSLLTVGIALANITESKIDWIHCKEYRVKQAVYRVTQGAMKVNRLSLVNFTQESTLTLKQIQGEIKKFYPGNYNGRPFYHNLLGHNVDFDLGFTQGYPFESGKRPQNIYDTMRIAQALKAAGLRYGKVKLQSCCDFHGITYNEDLAHGALYDAERTVEVFQAQLKILKQGIMANASEDLDLS
ncbi:putative DEDDh ribonuclease T homologue [Acaryochloris phage A-HIS2]|nr:ribonuclease T [Acaryochloris phage A-HIS2]CBA17834.1 putative DEDDh ribonuclease T homologue [Acaryochloris phage A-HIS2]